MEFGRAQAVFGELEQSSHESLKQDLVNAAAQYARIRVDWQLSDPASRRDMDSHRTRLHDAFIDCCNILSRRMAATGEEVEWRRELGTDRKEIGDFACFIHCLLGLRAR